jgi:hypothetical protein
MLTDAWDQDRKPSVAVTCLALIVPRPKSFMHLNTLCNLALALLSGSGSGIDSPTSLCRSLPWHHPMLTAFGDSGIELTRQPAPQHPSLL